MSHSPEFVQLFRSSAPYIHAHRGRTFVLHLSGARVQAANFGALLHDLAVIHALGVKLVIVHGSRPQIDAGLAKQGAKPAYHAGLRITDAAALQAAEEACGAIRVKIEALLSMGLPNSPMAGSNTAVASGNFISAKPIGVLEGVDLQQTGRVRRIKTQAIEQQLALGNIVVLSPLGYSLTGEVFNLSGEETAMQVACELAADKLIYLSDSTVATQRLPFTPAQARESNVANDLQGLLKHAATAAEQGVGRVHLVDGATDGAMLSELYTRNGKGLMITTGHFGALRQATIHDVAGILQIIEPLEAAGVLVKRSREQLELDIEHFTVVECDGMILACAAMDTYEAEQYAEIACVAVHTEYQKQHLGETLLAALETRAKELGVVQLFVLTTQTAHWFLENGFEAGDIAQLPPQKQARYNLQRNSKVFIKSL